MIKYSTKIFVYWKNSWFMELFACLVAESKLESSSVDSFKCIIVGAAGYRPGVRRNALYHSLGDSCTGFFAFLKSSIETCDHRHFLQCLYSTCQISNSLIFLCGLLIATLYWEGLLSQVWAKWRCKWFAIFCKVGAVLSLLQQGFVQSYTYNKSELMLTRRATTSV